MRTRVLALTLLFFSGCGGSESTSLPQGHEPAKLDAADFVDRIDHAYWPMAPGNRWVFREDGQRVEVTVTDQTKDILGIRATVVHDVVTEDGELVEDTYDWYAQDKDGNVWYLGEATKEFENGKVKTTGGLVGGGRRWRRGRASSFPGEPKVGQPYRQEYYRGEAEDAAEVLSLDERVAVPFGRFDHVLMTKDYTPLDPKPPRTQVLRAGIGPVLVLAVSGGSEREELIRFEQALGARIGGRPRRHPFHFKMLIARAATSSTVVAEIEDSSSISSFARRVSGIASVGLNAIELVNET